MRKAFSTKITYPVIIRAIARPRVVPFAALIYFLPSQWSYTQGRSRDAQVCPKQERAPTGIQGELLREYVHSAVDTPHRMLPHSFRFLSPFVPLVMTSRGTTSDGRPDVMDSSSDVKVDAPHRGAKKNKYKLDKRVRWDVRDSEMDRVLVLFIEIRRLRKNARRSFRPAESTDMV